MSNIVYYHAHCTDGFAAAYAVYKHFNDGQDTEFVACNYNEPAPSVEQYDGKNVIIVDFSFPVDVMSNMQKRAAKFTWLDHHKTAFEMYGLTPDVLHMQISDRINIVLDPNRSGALIAYDYFLDLDQKGRFLKLVHHIDDRDRWQFKLPETKAVHAALQLIKPWSFESWSALDQELFSSEDKFAAFVAAGETALQVQNNQVASAIKNPVKCYITYENSNEVIVRTSGLATNSTVHMSEIGHELCKQSGSYGLVYFIDQHGAAKCSLRSEGDYDVSIIAKFFGGGGHKNAAGFTVSVKELMQFLGKSL